MTIKDELHAIMEENGGMLDPVKVVNFARDPATLLNKKFDWDDSTAAEAYRIQQARKIIQLELVVIKKGSGKGPVSVAPFINGLSDDQPVREYVSLILDRGNGGYRAISDVLSDEELKSQLLEEAKRDMEIFKRKYRVLEKLSRVFLAMDDVQ